ncbi:unnamed protein product [Arabis nemorensis]|uniref:RNase H type-1 domain-containing protein n=1 Tax=Arabis nemorensis TaxID=586526 RepID=A0A565BEM5_9BRAS|nr:unnamed protein product [Arabis nemorensis]
MGLRDARGTVVLHSRRTFGGYETEADFKLGVMIWGIESMRSHRKERVIFSAQHTDLMGAVLRLKAWPNFRYHVHVLLQALSPMLEWIFEVANAGSNRGVFLIALSVTKDYRNHSYVSIGYPSRIIGLTLP